MRTNLAIAALLSAGPALAGDIPSSELSIAGVTSGATEASVIRQLGEPSERIDTGDGIELHYSGLVVTTGWLEQKAPGVQRRVLALLGTGSETCTPSGLCPGMPTSEVSRLYGPASPVQRESGTFLEYQPTDLACWLQVSASSALVESLAVVCQP